MFFLTWLISVPIFKIPVTIPYLNWAVIVPIPNLMYLLFIFWPITLFAGVGFLIVAFSNARPKIKK
jgi:hypothetical protein